MATNVHFITCVSRARTLFHEHVTWVGIGDNIGNYRERVSVAAVRTAIRAGDRFYTVSPTTGKAALVEVYDCPSCKAPTIRSAPDSVTDNDLDNIGLCS
jgi:Protein of unknown function (DUF3892)